MITKTDEAVIIEAAKLLLTSDKWPVDNTAIPNFNVVVKASFTPSMSLRKVSLSILDDSSRRSYLILQCNPEKVVRDIDGNEAFDKVMVKSAFDDGWLGQVRRYRRGKEDWHFHAFE